MYKDIKQKINLITINIFNTQTNDNVVRHNKHKTYTYVFNTIYY